MKKPISPGGDGAGPRVPVDFLITAVDNTFHDTLWNSSPEVDGTPQREVILLAPLGRGTKGYRDMAEDDVWQSMEITESLFAIDPDRRYLTGFSMGCSGAFRLAACKPDLWAAINLAAGFHDSSATRDVSLVPNLPDVPIYIWCGKDDTRMMEGLELTLPMWREHGLEPRSVIIREDIPHTYPYFEYARMLEMLLRETRRPAGM